MLSRSQADRVVVRGGRAIDTSLPDYRELDGLLARRRDPGCRSRFRAALDGWS
jgi:cytosine deaminase